MNKLEVVVDLPFRANFSSIPRTKHISKWRRNKKPCIVAVHCGMYVEAEDAMVLGAVPKVVGNIANVTDCLRVDLLNVIPRISLCA